jgi:peptidoglycan LD-endopeptidase CwlK
MPSRKISDLRPAFGAKCVRVLEACKAKGVELMVTCTLRTMDEQAELYAQGRTAPGHIVTNAKPGASAHNYGLAMDVVPVVNHKLEWDVNAPEWQVYADAVRAEGLQWGGDFTGLKDFPHCQLANWRDHIHK